MQQVFLSVHLLFSLLDFQLFNFGFSSFDAFKDRWLRNTFFFRNFRRCFAK